VYPVVSIGNSVHFGAYSSTFNPTTTVLGRDSHHLHLQIGNLRAQTGQVNYLSRLASDLHSWNSNPGCPLLLEPKQHFPQRMGLAGMGKCIIGTIFPAEESR
jgi:hypothetical protein